MSQSAYADVGFQPTLSLNSRVDVCRNSAYDVLTTLSIKSLRRQLEITKRIDNEFVEFRDEIDEDRFNKLRLIRKLQIDGISKNYQDIKKRIQEQVEENHKTILDLHLNNRIYQNENAEELVQQNKLCEELYIAESERMLQELESETNRYFQDSSSMDFSILNENISTK